MNKTIWGQTYDTETATLVRFWAAHGETDFRWHETGLYRRENGDYFLAGEGGIASDWGNVPEEYACDRGGIVPFDSNQELLDYMRSRFFTDEEIAAVLEDLYPWLPDENYP